MGPTLHPPAASTVLLVVLPRCWMASTRHSGPHANGIGKCWTLHSRKSNNQPGRGSKASVESLIPLRGGRDGNAYERLLWLLHQLRKGPIGRASPPIPGSSPNQANQSDETSVVGDLLRWQDRQQARHRWLRSSRNPPNTMKNSERRACPWLTLHFFWRAGWNLFLLHIIGMHF